LFTPLRRDDETFTDINIAEVKAEVEAAFAEYEQALISNDVETLDRLFLHSPNTIRLGTAENLYGYAETAAFRAGRPSAGLERSLERTVIAARRQRRVFADLVECLEGPLHLRGRQRLAVPAPEVHSRHDVLRTFRRRRDRP